MSIENIAGVPPRILANIYEQHVRDEAGQRLGNLNDLQAAIASAFGGESGDAVETYKKELAAVSNAAAGATGYTDKQHPDAIPL